MEGNARKGVGCCRQCGERPKLSVQTKTANHQQLVAGASLDVIAYVTSLLRLIGVLERAKGIEPSYAAWEAAVLPLNYARGSITCASVLNRH
jgi:hypothetical protein